MHTGHLENELQVWHLHIHLSEYVNELLYPTDVILSSSMLCGIYSLYPPPWLPLKCICIISSSLSIYRQSEKDERFREFWSLNHHARSQYRIATTCFEYYANCDDHTPWPRFPAAITPFTELLANDPPDGFCIFSRQVRIFSCLPR